MNVKKLTKEERDALGPEMFAFPRTRTCPINDNHHTVLAWAQVEGVKDATVEERIEARHRIMVRAQELKISTADWHRVKSMQLECMSLNIDASDHPNRMPFSGVLTRLDEPSDAAPAGSGGRRIIVTAEAAQAALPSLLGMAVNFTPSFDGHDTRNKIGIITSAEVVGRELRVAGFVYASDFPETAELIQRLKDVLGFSFEAQRLTVQDPSAEVLRITELTFTGAAILLKDKAAYNSTSLAAAAAGELDMTKEELQAILGEAIKPLTDRLAKVEEDSKVVVESVAAANAVRAKVEPLAVSLEAQATALEAAGIKGDHLRKMAADMRAEAAQGRMPASVAAPATSAVPAAVTASDEAVKKLIEDAVKPLKDQLAASETKAKDLEEKMKLQASGPARKTIAPMVSNLLSKAGLTLPEGEGKLEAGAVDQALAKANLNIPQRIMLKNELGRLGVLAIN